MVIISLGPDRCVGRVGRIVILPVNIHKAVDLDLSASYSIQVRTAILRDQRRSKGVSAHEDGAFTKLSNDIHENRRRIGERLSHFRLTHRARTLGELKERGGGILVVRHRERRPGDSDPKSRFDRTHNKDEVFLDCAA